MLECFFIKFNNHPAPPKVGVTAAESGTYTDFANINLGGLLADGSDGSNEVSHLLLEIIDEMHLLQPSSNLQLSRKTPDALLKHALRVIRKGYGFPSIFNADSVVEEQLRQGKTLEDARAGGCSGCVEVGAFGKEAYILTGYFNLVKILELALHDGVDPRTGKQLGAADRRSPDSLATFDDAVRRLPAAVAPFRRDQGPRQPAHRADVCRPDAGPLPFGAHRRLHRARARTTTPAAPATTTRFIQLVGIGSLTDSLAAIRQLVFDDRALSPAGLVEALDADFQGQEPLRQRMLNKTHKYGNDDDSRRPDHDPRLPRLLRGDRRPAQHQGRTLPRGDAAHHLPRLLRRGDRRHARTAGRPACPCPRASRPVQGADRYGPTAVVKSAAKMDHVKTGGTLLNMKFTPIVGGRRRRHRQAGPSWCGPTSSWTGTTCSSTSSARETLREAQAQPERHRDLIVRVAGYSDYFCDLSVELQEEIIARTEHATL